MAEIILTIEGMSCQHCVMSVKKAVESISGVASADVSIGKAKVVFDESKTNRDEIALAIHNAGYKVKAGG
ncbi:MAG: heavy-metal-associated domain-containing protein [Nitrospirae bacterium]|nr:heavy-metal-associated domain-containing protein [Nitrospirota bacterium]